MKMVSHKIFCFLNKTDFPRKTDCTSIIIVGVAEVKLLAEIKNALAPIAIPVLVAQECCDAVTGWPLDDVKYVFREAEARLGMSGNQCKMKYKETLNS